MEFVKLPMKVIVRKEELDFDFIAKRRAKSEKLYKRRGGFKAADLICGLAGEIACHKTLSAQYAMGEVDTTMHERASYASDLDSNDGKKFHIKSQNATSKRLYGASWLCQQTDKLFRGAKDHEYFIFCDIELEETVTEENVPEEFVVNINCIVKIGHLTGMFAEPERMVPRMPHMRFNKYAIYLDEVIAELAAYKLRKSNESKIDKTHTEL